LAQADGLLVTDIRRESHSAKSTGQRPVYNQLITDIKGGLFNGILTWAADRLSRNAGYLGSLVDLMDNGYLTEIRSHGQIFTNSPNDKPMLIHRRMQDQNSTNDSAEIEPKFDLTGFIEYIFRDGTREQKGKLVGCLNRAICLKGKKIYSEL
jgi:hypothetical protein